jgi:anti-sigma B factor antagonist
MLSIDGIDAGGAVRIAGRLDAAQAPAAQSQFDRLAGVVTLDCTHLDYISSAGLGVLLKTHKRLAAGAGALRLQGVKPHIRDIFEYSGFDQIFDLGPAG